MKEQGYTKYKGSIVYRLNGNIVKGGDLYHKLQEYKNRE